jgi:hypothetical protein
MRRYAQPCFDHEYIDPQCPKCGWIAEVFDCAVVERFMRMHRRNCAKCAPPNTSIGERDDG